MAGGYGHIDETVETEGKWMIAYRDIKDIEVEK